MFPDNYPFTLDELRRFTAYKAAVKAGFYTDSLPSGDAKRADGTRSSCVSGTKRQSTASLELQVERGSTGYRALHRMSRPTES
jgi:hypothetical protein